MKTDGYAMLRGRKVGFYSHGTEPEWGYAAPQTDSYAVIHPKDEKKGVLYPLYVVFHSAGHELFSTLRCMLTKGDHDIYHTPDDSFALVLDCYANRGDWWWGGISPKGVEEEVGDPENFGTAFKPVELRCADTVIHVRDTFPIDPERIYAVGNSMGGSGALGIGMSRGDIFAAVKANVPAGVLHATERCAMFGERPEGFTLPDPPVTVDYSSQVDQWSGGHERLYLGARERKFPLIGFFGAYGHANNNEVIEKFNDLVHSFDIGTVRLHDPYPVFTDATTDDPLPWPDHRDSEASGQVNCFFRWKNVSDEPDRFEIELRLLRPDEWKSRVTFPTSSVADVTVRRRQKFLLSPGEAFTWEYAGHSGTTAADCEGLPTVPRIEISTEPHVLILKK